MNFFVTNKNIVKNIVVLENDDINHLKNVLRKKVGENIDICNNDTGEQYICKIIKIDEKIECEIIEKIDSKTESNVKITILQGLPKADKMELIIQKAVELGVDKIIPIEMKRCVVKLNDKDKVKKVDRWQKISEVAAKQSLRSKIPKIENVLNIKNIDENDFDYLIVAYECEKELTLKQEIKRIKEQVSEQSEMKIGILIGPEGGIDDSEIDIMKQKAAKIITLGNRILRTETVALNMLSIFMYELEK